MARLSALDDLKVLVPKKPKEQPDGSLKERTSKLGRVHMAVFSPDSTHVVGLMVRRPDVVGVVKVDDAFLALDSFELGEKCLVVTRPKDGLDDAARRRLGLDWDSCVMWLGMDARSRDGEELGYVTDAEYDPATGAVEHYLVTTGSVSKALVGTVDVTPDMVLGYSRGCMVVDPKGRSLEPEGGLAAAAGEGYARAKVEAKAAGQKAGAAASEAGQKAGAAASEAVDKGSYAFGRWLGKTKRALDEYMADDEDEGDEDEADDEGAGSAGSARGAAGARGATAPAVEALDVRVSEPVEALPATDEERADAAEPVTYVPVSEAAGDGAAAGAADAAAGAGAAGAASPKKPQATASSKSSSKKSSGGSSKSSGSSKKASSKASAKKSSAKKASEPSTADKAARAVGRQLGAFGKMFGEFKEEYKKASQ